MDTHTHTHTHTHSITVRVIVSVLQPKTNKSFTKLQNQTLLAHVLTSGDDTQVCSAFEGNRTFQELFLLSGSTTALHINKRRGLIKKKRTEGNRRKRQTCFQTWPHLLQQQMHSRFICSNHTAGSTSSCFFPCFSRSPHFLHNHRLVF